MGMVLDKYVQDPKKRAMLGWVKTLVIIAVFIIVIQGLLGNSTYMQGFEDCKKQVATSLGQSYVDSIFPNVSDDSFDYQEQYEVIQEIKKENN